LPTVQFVFNNPEIAATVQKKEYFSIIQYDVPKKEFKNFENLHTNEKKIIYYCPQIPYSKILMRRMFVKIKRTFT